MSTRSIKSKEGPGRKQTYVNRKSRRPNGYKEIDLADEDWYYRAQKKTEEAGQPLHIVHDDNGVVTGLRCPEYIYNSVVGKAPPPRNPVQPKHKPSQTLVNSLKETIMSQYPKMPPNEAAEAAAYAVERPHRIGCQEGMPLPDRGRLTVGSFIRHRKTNYDELCKSGMSKPEARAQILASVNELSKEWGGQPVRNTLPQYGGTPATEEVTLEARAKAALAQAIRTLKALVGVPDRTPRSRSRNVRAALSPSALAAAATTVRCNTRRRTKLTARAAAQRRNVYGFAEDAVSFHDNDDDDKASVMYDLEEWYNDYSRDWAGEDWC